jgi:hypothetical protein
VSAGMGKKRAAGVGKRPGLRPQLNGFDWN